MSNHQIMLDLAQVKTITEDFTRTDAIVEFSCRSQAGWSLKVIMAKCPATGDNPINSQSQTPQTETTDAAESLE